jgi:hypothetical protein
MLENLDVLPPQGREQRAANGQWMPGVVPAGARPWQKGQVPNPSGKSGAFADCQRLCREHSFESAQAIMRLARETKDECLAFMAHTWIYERAWGRARDYDPRSEPDMNKPKFDPRLLSPEELNTVEFALRLMVKAMRIPSESGEGDAEWPDAIAGG